MLRPSGNPKANNLLGSLHTMQKKEGVYFEVKASR